MGQNEGNIEALFDWKSMPDERILKLLEELRAVVDENNEVRRREDYIIQKALKEDLSAVQEQLRKEQQRASEKSAEDLYSVIL